MIKYVNYTTVVKRTLDRVVMSIRPSALLIYLTAGWKINALTFISSVFVGLKDYKGTRLLNTLSNLADC